MSLTALAFLFSYFAGLLLACFQRPVWGLYVYFLAFYASPSTRWWGGWLPEIRWSLVAAVVTLFSLLVRGQGGGRWLSFIETKLFVFFAVYVCVQMLWAENLSVHMEYVFLVLKFTALLFLLHSLIDTYKDFLSILIVNIVGCGYFGWYAYTSHSGGRFEKIGTSGMDDANLLSMHVAPILISGSYLLLCKMSKYRYLLVPLVLLCLNLIMLTQSRGTILAIVISSLFALLFVPGVAASKFKVFFVLACMAGSMLVGPDLVRRIETTLNDEDTGQVEKSAESRFVIIEAQYNMWKEKPVFGYGHRGTLLKGMDYIPEEYLSDDKGVRASHNLVMSMLVDHGLVGFLLYFSAVAAALYRGIKIFDRKLVGDVIVENLNVILIGLVVSLLCFILASQSANSKKLELDIWYLALIPICTYLINKGKLKSEG